jgi:hypothetical protein
VAAGCTGSVGDPFSYFRSDALYYLSTLESLGVPMVFGEYGARTNYPEEWFIVGANDAAHILMEQVGPMKVATPGARRPGILFWHASGGDLRFLRKLESEGGSGIDQNQAFEWNEDPAELNWQGTAMLAYAQAVNP